LIHCVRCDRRTIPELTAWTRSPHAGVPFTRSTRWRTTLSSKVNLPLVINCRAKCGTILVTYHPRIEGQRDPGTPPSGQIRHLWGEVESDLVGSTEGFCESRRCSWDTYPESYITEYTSVCEEKEGVQEQENLKEQSFGSKNLVIKFTTNFDLCK